MARSWGERAEPVFRAWARIVVAHPLAVLLPTLAVALLAISGLAWLRIDVTFESFLERDDPVLIAYEDFAATFGRDERIVISAAPGTAATSAGVFEPRFLERRHPDWQAQGKSVLSARPVRIHDPQIRR